MFSSPASPAPGTRQVDASGWQFAVTAGILGWVLDAFDFFVVIFLVDTLASHFGVEKKTIVWTISITLAMRPVGALLSVHLPIDPAAASRLPSAFFTSPRSRC